MNCLQSYHCKTSHIHIVTSITISIFVGATLVNVLGDETPSNNCASGNSPNKFGVLDVDADTDRTGRIEGSRQEEAAEVTHSLVVLNNCDDDDNNGERDSLDDRINGEDDFADTEPLIVRRSRIEAGANAQLIVENVIPDSDVLPENIVRIFDDCGSEIIGPEAGAAYTFDARCLDALRSQDVRFTIEGLLFGESVHLKVVVHSQVVDSLRVDVAPFLLTPHTRLPRSGMVCNVFDWPESKVFADQFTKYCNVAGVTAIKVHDNQGDVWVEDEVAWGVTSTPRKSMPVALHMLRDRGLRRYVERQLQPDVGYFKAFDYWEGDQTALDYGGNLEVTPPTRNFPFGRVYYGSIPSEGIEYDVRAISQGFQDFFKKQKFQSPIDLKSDWLNVGHVDEVITFVPKKDSSGFVLLLASPSLGLNILHSMGNSTKLNNHYQDYNASTVGDLFGKRYFMRSFEDYNLDVDEKIFGPDHAKPTADSIKGILMDALSLTEDEVREVPVLFENSASENSWLASALTPGMVNLSSVGECCIVPDPFIPEFREAFSYAIRGTGQVPLWIDDWDVYHLGAGEVHCGSNERRDPFPKKWWESSQLPIPSSP